jgi:hypothetical protein
MIWKAIETDGHRIFHLIATVIIIHNTARTHLLSHTPPPILLAPPALPLRSPYKGARSAATSARPPDSALAQSVNARSVTRTRLLLLRLRRLSERGVPESTEAGHLSRRLVYSSLESIV